MLTRLALTGIWDDVPDLRLVIAGVDAGWIPYVLEAADTNYLRTSASRPVDLRREDALPSDYVRRHVFATFGEDRFAALSTRYFGPHHLLWSAALPTTFVATGPTTRSRPPASPPGCRPSSAGCCSAPTAAGCSGCDGVEDFPDAELVRLRPRRPRLIGAVGSDDRDADGWTRRRPQRRGRPRTDRPGHRRAPDRGLADGGRPARRRSPTRARTRATRCPTAFVAGARAGLPHRTGGRSRPTGGASAPPPAPAPTPSARTAATCSCSTEGRRGERARNWRRSSALARLGRSTTTTRTSTPDWREERLLIDRCRACGRWQHPPRPICPACWSTDIAPDAGRRHRHRAAVDRYRVLDPVFGGVDPDGARMVTVELDEQPGCASRRSSAGRDEPAVGDARRRCGSSSGHGTPFPVFVRRGRWAP